MKARGEARGSSARHGSRDAAGFVRARTAGETRPALQSVGAHGQIALQSLAARPPARDCAGGEGGHGTGTRGAGLIARMGMACPARSGREGPAPLLR